VSWNRGLRILERTDTILGRVRLCTTCKEDWPVDEEFWYFDRDGRVMGRCRACWVDFNRSRRKPKVAA
jgi:hypothetical protein